MNAVHTGAASSSKFAILSVQNKAMADRMGLALTPNLHIEGDPTIARLRST